MSDNKTYQVKINKTNRISREIAGFLFFIWAVGFAIWYVVDLPVKYQYEISIAYYSNLPTWINHIFSWTIITGLVSLVLFTLRSNSNGILSLRPDHVEIKTKRELHVIKFSMLQRIAIVEKTFSFRPHRLEFIFPNKKCIRVVFSSEQAIEEVIMRLHQISPDKLDKEVMQFESHEY